MANGQITFKYDYPENLARKLINEDSSGIKILSVNYIGDSKSFAAYYCPTDILPVKNGIILSTGIAERAGYTNETESAGTARFTQGNQQLEQIAGDYTIDAAILEIWFLANTNQINFQYFFASEEYPEFVNKGVNDVFAFFIEGPGYDSPANIALLPGTSDPISVDNVNAGKNQQFYIDNPPIFKAITNLSMGFQFDGLTTPLIASANVQPYKRYKLTMAIADVGDNIYDSGVFIKLRSLVSNGTRQPLKDDLTYLLNDKIKLINLHDIGNKGDTVKFSKTVKFDFDSYDILPDDTLALDEIIKVLNRFFDTKIKIVGHTDEKGTRDYNFELSKLRAQSVANYFILKGIATNRIEVLGKGKLHPIDKSGTELAHKRNRRVEFLIYQ
jgi:outer membrane protein OmpA-like peptidoglycan-associated protein